MRERDREREIEEKEKGEESKVWRVINVGLLMGWGYLTFLTLNQESDWNNADSTRSRVDDGIGVFLRY